MWGFPLLPSSAVAAIIRISLNGGDVKILFHRTFAQLSAANTVRSAIAPLSAMLTAL
jgi:hypothetical protein